MGVQSSAASGSRAAVIDQGPPAAAPERAARERRVQQGSGRGAAVAAYANVIATLAALAVIDGCARERPAEVTPAADPSIAASDLRPPGLAGQQVTCAGPRTKTFALTVREGEVDLGMATRFHAWTYDGRLPGPTLEACEGDTVTITVHNTAAIAHGLDTHALTIDARKFGPTEPGETLTIQGTAATPGVFMYHCSVGPVTDIHIKSGMHGPMIVYPRGVALRPAYEAVVVQDAIFGERDADGVILGGDTQRMKRNDPEFRLFNGRLEHEPRHVVAGELVRLYLVNVGPGVSAAHVVGGMFDAVIDGSTIIHAVQTYAVAPGAGAILEFRVPEPGEFVLVDHDQLGFLPLGLGLRFVAER